MKHFGAYSMPDKFSLEPVINYLADFNGEHPTGLTADKVREHGKLSPVQTTNGPTSFSIAGEPLAQNYKFVLANNELTNTGINEHLDPRNNSFLYS